MFKMKLRNKETLMKQRKIINVKRELMKKLKSKKRRKNKL